METREGAPNDGWCFALALQPSFVLEFVFYPVENAPRKNQIEGRSNDVGHTPIALNEVGHVQFDNVRCPTSTRTSICHFPKIASMQTKSNTLVG